MAGLVRYIVIVLYSWYLPALAAGKSSPKQVPSRTSSGGTERKESNAGQEKKSGPGQSQIAWKSKNSLSVRLGSGLTQKQLSTLNSGFSTFSRLTIGKADTSRENREKWSVASTACTVKFDMWEERYEVTLLTKNPSHTFTKSLETYLDLCLKVDVTDEPTLKLLRKKGGQLVAILEVEQISSSQAHKIKKWLVKQQSAVMRGLFTHMLGEMTLSARSEITLKVSSAQ